MIHYLEGKLTGKIFPYAILDVAGMGYEVLVSLSCFERLPELGSKLKLLTYFHVREDLQQLYGFLEEEERRFFKLLISVSGIGPKGASNILSGIRVVDLKQAILVQDPGRLSGVSGVGKKTAERIVLELKEKIDPGEIKGETKTSSTQSPLWDDALLALIALGYTQVSAQKALRKAITEDGKKSTVEELVRKSLQYV